MPHWFGVQASGPARWAWWGVLAWTVAMLWLALTSAPQHDYRAYIGQWHTMLSGGDPWSTSNAYGPLHNALALLLPLGNNAPKLATAGAMLAANLALAADLLNRRGLGWELAPYLLAVPTNILIVGMGVIFGLNDALVAALLVAAVLCRLNNRFALAGVLVGLAVLTKYYPLAVLVPLAIDGRRLRPALLIAGATTIVAGLSATYLFWGDTFLRAFRYGDGRNPAMLSVFNALGGASQLVGGRAMLDWLIDNNSTFVVLTVIVSGLAGWLGRWHWLEAATVSLLAVLLAYKVGHQQFFIGWLFLVAALPLAGKPSADRLAWFCVPMAVYLSVFEWGYQFGTDHYSKVGGGIRQYGGFLALLLGLLPLAVWPLTRWRQSPETPRPRT